MLTSLLSFNLGVELGQILVLLILLPALELLFSRVVAERVGTIILSTLVAHTAWHWMTERFQTLRQFQFVWPDLTASFMLWVVRWLMLIVVLTGVIWAIRVYRQGSAAPRTE